MKDRFRVLHYLNQFFGGIGGESEADVPLQWPEKLPGPAQALQYLLGDRFQVIACLCGDNRFHEQRGAVTGEVLAQARMQGVDLVVAGPAFNAGRYGVACGEVCRTCTRAGIPSVTAMYGDNPAVPMYRRDAYIFPTTSMAVGMADALARIAPFVRKLALGEPLGPAAVEGYISRGIRQVISHDRPAAQRAVDMLEARLQGKPYVSELILKKPRVVPPALAVRDLSKAAIALVTTGGLVTKGNPEGMRSYGEDRYLRHSLANRGPLAAGQYESIHGGITVRYLNENPEYAAPIQVAWELEEQGAFARLHPQLYAMVGVLGVIQKFEQAGRAIAGELRDASVDAVILTST